MIGNALGFLQNDVAIDLGTANTLVYASGRGIVVEEPSVVAIVKPGSSAGGRVLAVGAEAKRMIGRTPGSIIASRPLKDGMIADFESTETMLRAFIDAAVGRRAMAQPRVVVGVPSGITEVAKRAVQDCARSAGAREVFLVPEPLAAALGAQLPVMEPVGSMIVDIGGGTTEVAVMSLGGMAATTSIRVAGDAMDEAIAAGIRRKFGCVVGERAAEEIKLQVGCASRLRELRSMTVKGRDVSTGAPRQFEYTSDDAADALTECVAQVTEAIRKTLEQTPPELAADILDQGIVLAGGGSLLAGLDEVLRDATGLPVSRADDPLRCVALGAGRILEDPGKLQRMAV